MIELYKFGPAFGLRETGPFVLKTMSYMRLAGIEFTEHVETDPRKAPKKKSLISSITVRQLAIPRLL